MNKSYLLIWYVKVQNFKPGVVHAQDLAYIAYKIAGLGFCLAVNHFMLKLYSTL